MDVAAAGNVVALWGEQQGDAWRFRPPHSALKWDTIGSAPGAPLDRGSFLNTALMLEHHPHFAGALSFDAFRAEVLVGRQLLNVPWSRPRSINKTDLIAIRRWLHTQGLAPGVRDVQDAILEIASRRTSEPVQEWLAGLQWDRQERLATWLTALAGVADTPYARAAGSKFLIAACARAFSPGCKADCMLILEGPQGARKSSLLRELIGREWFSDQLGDIRGKDASELLHGHWLVEVPEMDKLTGHAARTIKEFVSRQTDKYRPAYAPLVEKHPRRCVFAGTINPQKGVGYLNDPTGARRFWPVTCGAIDIPRAQREREQLWAEALAAYRAGVPWWVEEDEAEALFMPQQAERTEEDVWTPAVAKWLAGAPPQFSASWALEKAVRMELERQGQSDKLRMATVLAALGCEPTRGERGAREWKRV